MAHVKRIEQHGRNRYGAVDASAAFFETFNDEDPVAEIDSSRGQVKGFRDTASGIIQEAAKGAHLLVVLARLGEGGLALAWGEVETPAEGIV